MIGNTMVDEKSMRIDFSSSVLEGFASLQARNPLPCKRQLLCSRRPTLHPLYSARVTSKMPSLSALLLCADYRQHPTATIHVTAENSDPMFRSHTNTCSLCISLSLL